MKKNVFIGTITLILVLGALASGCRHHSGLHEERADKIIRYLTDELKLSDAQQKMLVNFKEDMLKKRDASQECKEKSKAIIMEELKKDRIDQEQLMSIYADHKPKMDEMATFVISSLADFHETLTEDQRTILMDKLETFDKWHSYFAD